MPSRRQQREKRSKKAALLYTLIAICAIISIALIVFFVKNPISARQRKDALRDDSEISQQAEPGSDEQNNGNSSDSEQQGQSSPSDAKLELVTQENAPYEHWLAAASITGISLQYPDYDSVEFYIADTTEIKDSRNSKGIYVSFNSEGERCVVYSGPLDAQRTKQGTMDLYSETIGYATFDPVNDAVIPNGFRLTNIDNLNELITQSVRVMLTEN